MELEIKAETPENIRKKLEDIGADYEGTVEQRDIYFNHPKRDFMRTDEAFRIRYEGERVFLTYKGPKVDGDAKIREEIEFAVKDGKKAEIMLEKLGFIRAGEVSKKREIYILNDIHICLDDVKSIGLFVELEINGENTEENRKKLFNIAKRLDITESIRESYFEMSLKK